MDIKIEAQGKTIKVTTWLLPDQQPTETVWHTPQVALQYITLMSKQGINFIIEQTNNDKQTKLL
jgi:hypothetical protein